MENTVATYKIHKLNEPFKLKELCCDKTVVVSTFVCNKLVSKIKYGYIDKKALYEQIKLTNNINLSNCYVKDFSITDYKKNNGINESTNIDINNFVAENTFFDCTLISDFSYINFKGVVKINNSVFNHGNVSFYQSKFLKNTDVEFINTRFGNGKINFQYVTFSEKKVLFTAAKFYGGTASFVSANFNNGDALFNDINFYDCKVEFHYASFGIGGVNFQKTKFGNKTIDFRKVEFGEGRVDFRRSIFGNGSVTFDEAEISKGKFNFRLAKFGNNDVSFRNMNFGKADVLFENVNFGKGDVSFCGCIAQNISFKASKFDVYLDLNVKQVTTIDLSETVVRDIIDLKTVNHKVNIKKLYLHGMRNLGRIIIDWKNNNVKNLITAQVKTTLWQKAEQFNLLKENFRSNGQYNDEDEAYIQFKRFELQAGYQRTLKLGGIRLIKLPSYIFRWLIFDKMGLYATSPLRVLTSMLFIYIIFSLFYLLLPILNLGDIVNAVGATDGLNYFQICFYHSAITFLTIGYGDYYPIGFSRGISIVEGWMGLFLMSYFTVAFVRKILR